MTLILNSLSVRSGRRLLVDDVSLTLPPGSRTALVGASGAGKSLTCAALAGILPPGIEVGGSLTHRAGTAPDEADEASGSGRQATNLLHIPAARRPRGSRIALVPQDPTTALHPLIPVGAQIRLAARRAGGSLSAAARTAELLDAVGLEESIGARVPGRLSGGQRQRASLALALAGEPALILADEPTTALDVIARAEVLDLLTGLTQLTGLTDAPQAPALLLITHDLPAAAICQQIAVLDHGRLIESGPTREVLAQPSHPISAAMCRAAGDETIEGALEAMAALDARDAREVQEAQESREAPEVTAPQGRQAATAGAAA